ncbi:MAG TPA: 3-phosphoshikimate 1-carboxyvinyltransferase [Saprospiraceae bacterium]|nr:3-phosphoshikimate 1-carboxyvinyltransferase [Saprospiraceae bacterium]
MAIIIPESITIEYSGGRIEGEISLNRSKSISNRVLIIRALANEKFPIVHLSDSDDTQTLMQLLSQVQNGTVLDAHHAGTTYRFLCAWLCTQPGTQILTGSFRMKERPIKALVDALRSIGAQIEYLEKKGFPPVQIGPPPVEWKSRLSLPANISSQYISALMMIAPVLSHGLEIRMEGVPVSIPYIAMTSALMHYFGIRVHWEESVIKIEKGTYQSIPFTVEADWSAASYYYSIAALADEAFIYVDGLNAESMQGDSKVVELMRKFGIETTYSQNGISIEKKGAPNDFFQYDFLYQPDLAQTFAVLCGGLGVRGKFTGLQTLRIKETDRIHALQKELVKVGVQLTKIPLRPDCEREQEYYSVDGKARYNEEVQIETYHDHRMAMAFAPLAVKFPLRIVHPAVVSKSYPGFWEDLLSLGFRIR